MRGVVHRTDIKFRNCLFSTRRIAVDEHLSHARERTGDAWQEQRKRVTAARDELEQKTDELSTKLN